MGICWFARRLHPSFLKAFQYIFLGLFFNQTSRFVLESYTPLMQTLLEHLQRGLNWTTPIYIFLSANDIVFAILYGLFPLGVTLYLYKNVKYFKKYKFRSRWVEIIDNLSWRRRSSPFFIAIFCYRRLFLALLVVLLADYPFAQIMLTVFSNQSVIILLGLSKPFRFGSEERLEFFNEANIMICSYHLFLFTDFVDGPLMRHNIGISMIVFTTLNIAVNLGIAFYSSLREMYR
jgi:hypothetical protein